jgi:3-phosphoshikimate 1-carboxyvinyltransferase
VRVPGSKSLTNRALLIASLANGKTRLVNALFSDDSKYFANALKTLGFDIQLDELNHEIIITGLGGKIPAQNAELFIGNAGTAARFLSAFLTLGSGEYILDGEPRMRERPIGDLIDALAQLGCTVQPIPSVYHAPLTMDDSRSSIVHRPICPPVKIISNGLPGGKTKIAGNISSQFLSALLMVAPYAKSPIEIELSTDLNSKPYVEMTISIMKDFGVQIERDDYSQFTIHRASYSPLSMYPIESDASAASYFFAAPAICGGTVRVENISRNSKQGDIAFLDILAKMGCTIQETENCIRVTANSQPHGIDVDMRDIPDTAQTLAAIAPFATSPTQIRGIASARAKETDRVHATCVELQRLGVQVEEHEDGMTIYPCKTFRASNPSTGSEQRIQTYNDHRMAMSFALIGLRVEGIAIENPACVSKTFPNYFEVLETLR